MKTFFAALLFLLPVSAFSQQVRETDAEMKWVTVSVDNAKSVDVVLKLTTDADCNTNFTGTNVFDLQGLRFMIEPGFIYTRMGCQEPKKEKVYTSKPMNFQGIKIANDYFVSVGLLVPKNSQIEIVNIQR